jgi:hypothetical protein
MDVFAWCNMYEYFLLFRISFFLHSKIKYEGPGLLFIFFFYFCFELLLLLLLFTLSFILLLFIFVSSFLIFNLF